MNSVTSDDARIRELAGTVGAALAARGAIATTAESCTGGWVAAALTAIAGSSAWFDRGFVTYSNEAKQDMLGVQAATLVRHGAVSEATVAEMVTGALAASRASHAVAISGIAGPSGGSADKPVGTVCFAWGGRDAPPHCETRHFDGDRTAVRAQAVIHALEGLLRNLTSFS